LGCGDDQSCDGKLFGVHIGTNVIERSGAPNSLLYERLVPQVSYDHFLGAQFLYRLRLGGAIDQGANRRAACYERTHDGTPSFSGCTSHQNHRSFSTLFRRSDSPSTDSILTQPHLAVNRT
jgi:hypothetical protein